MDRICLGLLLPLSLVACSVEAPTAKGRPCSVDQPCGPGTFCSAAGVCEAQDVDAGADQAPVVDLAITKDKPPGKDKAPPPKDLPKKDAPIKDAPPADRAPPKPDKFVPKPDKFVPKPDKFVPQPDKFVPKPDLGCPAGTTKCGATCVNLKTDAKNCGKCNSVCSTTNANSCVNGTCSCGSLGVACGGGLNCVSGACRCIAGGLCIGCCDNNLCRFIGGLQSVAKCGSGGKACAPCKDNNTCTNDQCVSGTCAYPPTPPKACSDGLPCTFSDTCSGGTCMGTNYTCSDSLACTTDACTGQAPPNQCKYTINAGYCVISGACYTTGTKNPGNSCLWCDPSKSVSSWTPITGCGGSTTVSTLVPTVQFVQPTGVAVDTSGNIYLSDTYGHKVWKISGGSATVIAGTGVKGYKDGAPSVAQFSYPSGLAVDANGTVIVADSSNNMIRSISASGSVSTVAGTGSSGSSDGSALQASFYLPFDVALDNSRIYVADTYNYRIRLIAAGQVSTLAGGTYGHANGTGTAAKFTTVNALAYHNGYLYVADGSNHRIRLVSTSGVVTTIAGTGATGRTNGPALSATFNEPHGIAIAPSGRIYVGDRKNHVIRVIYNNTVSTLAGTGGVSGYTDGAAAQARFYDPQAVVTYSVGGAGYVYVADYYNHKLRQIKLPGPP